MKLSTSILSVVGDLKPTIDELNSTHTDFIHLDIMDGVFVSNKTWDIETLKAALENNYKPLDVHLMVSDVKKYALMFSVLKPRFITFHYEACDDIEETIDYIRSLGADVGIAISPETKVEAVYPYLRKLDLVLILSVNPGQGGQTFMLPTIKKIEELRNYRSSSVLRFLISVDGGINDTTVKLARGVDMVVAGSYVTKGDINHNVNTLKNS